MYCWYCVYSWDICCARLSEQRGGQSAVFDAASGSTQTGHHSPNQVTTQMCHHSPNQVITQTGHHSPGQVTIQMGHHSPDQVTTQMGHHSLNQVTTHCMTCLLVVSLRIDKKIFTVIVYICIV